MRAILATIITALYAVIIFVPAMMFWTFCCFMAWVHKTRSGQ